MNEIVTVLIFARAFERLLVVVSAGFIAYLGYKLFVFGSTEGSSKLKMESEWLKLVFSGSAPGLFFVLCGAIILAISLLKGSIEAGITREPLIKQEVQNSLKGRDSSADKEETMLENFRRGNHVAALDEKIHGLKQELDDVQNKISVTIKGLGGGPPSNATQEQLENLALRDRLQTEYRIRQDRIVTELRLLKEMQAKEFKKWKETLSPLTKGSN